MKIKILLSICLLVIMSTSLPAKPIAVKSVRKDATGMTMQMEPGVLQLHLCGDRTIHVLYSPTGDLPQVPSGFAVQKQPGPGVFDISETAVAVRLKAAQFSAVVDKMSGAIAFLGSDGKPFLQEALHGGKALTPSSSLSKKS